MDARGLILEQYSFEAANVPFRDVVKQNDRLLAAGQLDGGLVAEDIVRQARYSSAAALPNALNQHGRTLCAPA